MLLINNLTNSCSDDTNTYGSNQSSSSMIIGEIVSFYFSYQSWNISVNFPFFFEITFPLKFSTGTILSPPSTIISVAWFSASSIVISRKDIFSINPYSLSCSMYLRSFFMVVPEINMRPTFDDCLKTRSCKLLSENKSNVSHCCFEQNSIFQSLNPLVASPYFRLVCHQRVLHIIDCLRMHQLFGTFDCFHHKFVHSFLFHIIIYIGLENAHI